MESHTTVDEKTKITTIHYHPETMTATERAAYAIMLLCDNGLSRFAITTLAWGILDGEPRPALAQLGISDYIEAWDPDGWHCKEKGVF